MWAHLKQMDAALQASLFKGKRQRGERPPAALEFRTCCALADTLDRFLTPGWRYTHLPFGENRSASTGARLKRMGTRRGWPDYLFCGPGRALLFLEMKRKGGRPSPDQVAVAAHLAHCGFDYLCAQSYQDAVAALVARGILRGVEVQ